MSNFVRSLVIEPQNPSVYERELTSDQVFDLGGGPLEIIDLRAGTDDSHALEMSVGHPNEYHPDHWFELDGKRYIGTAVIIARNENGELVNVDVSALPMDEHEFNTELRERNLAVDDGDVIGGPFIPDGRYRVYELKTNAVLCDSKTYQGLIDAFATWLRSYR